MRRLFVTMATATMALTLVSTLGVSPAGALPSALPAATVLPTATAARTGRLTLVPKGLVSGRSVTVKVSGPGGYAKKLTLKAGSRSSLTALRSGTYTVRAGDSTITTGSRRGVYWTPVARLTVKAGTTTTRTLTYAKLVLKPTGLGPLKIGMTWAQATKADPSLKLHRKETCTYANSDYGWVAFNPSDSMDLPGRLSYIDPQPVNPKTGMPYGTTTARTKLIATSRGLRIGDTIAKANTLYPGHDDPNEYRDFVHASVGKKWTFPMYWVSFDRPAGQSYSRSASWKINGIALNGGQYCFE